LSGKRAPKPVSKSKSKEDEDDLFSKADRVQDAANSEASPFASFDPEAPLDGFHFAVKHKVESSELSRYFWQMKRRGLARWLMEGLSRGIGVHHAGMNRKYRQV
jgi:ATP-dependent RNA helicase DDX60